jgi:hypothetical protein
MINENRDAHTTAPVAGFVPLVMMYAPFAKFGEQTARAFIR